MRLFRAREYSLFLARATFERRVVMVMDVLCDVKIEESTV